MGKQLLVENFDEIKLAFFILGYSISSYKNEYGITFKIKKEVPDNKGYLHLYSKEIVLTKDDFKDDILVEYLHNAINIMNRSIINDLMK